MESSEHFIIEELLDFGVVGKVNDPGVIMSMGTSSKDKSSNGLVLFPSATKCPVAVELASRDLPFAIVLFWVFELFKSSPIVSLTFITWPKKKKKKTSENLLAIFKDTNT